MATVMFQFRHTGKSPSLDEVRKEFGLAVGEIDSAFGVIQTDSAEHLYTVLVDEKAAKRIQSKLSERGADKDPAVGVFSNPPIGPFGKPDVTM